MRLDPEQAGIVGALGHREDAGGIGLQNDFRRDLDDAAHALDFPSRPPTGATLPADVSDILQAALFQELLEPVDIV